MGGGSSKQRVAPQSADQSKLQAENDALRRQTNAQEQKIRRLHGHLNKISGSTNVSIKIANRVRKKRLAVSAEATANTNKRSTKVETTKPDVVPKDPSSTALLLAAVKDSILFHVDANPSAAQGFVNSFAGPENVAQGTNIITQGESGDEAAKLYVVQTGECKILVDGTEVGTYTAGQSFGELALMYNQPRKATIQATTDCQVWYLERKVFSQTAQYYKDQQNQKICQVLSRVPSLKVLTDRDRQILSESLEESSHEDGEYIIREGQAGDHFYIIDTGTVLAVKEGQGTVATMGPGDFFGERALLSEEQRAASCVVQGDDCVVLSLDREHFEMMMGSLDMYVAAEEEQTASKVNETRGGGVTNAAPSHVNGITLNDLHYVAVLGEGAFGRVSLVTRKDDKNSKNPTTYALKAMKKAMIVDNGLEEHIVNEKQVMQALDNPGLLKLYATFQDDCRLYLLLELCQGGELFTYLRDSWKFPEKTAKFYAGSVALGFQHMHSKNIIYRDLKPENLLLDNEGWLKIADFGLAKDVKDGLTYTLCGTPDYLAPEIILSKGHSKPCDYWALGILVYELCVGEVPFYSDDPMEVYQLILRNEISYPSKFPKQIKSIVNKFCTLNPQKRLGATKQGFSAIQKHAWFSGFHWDAIINRNSKEIQIPIKPKVKSSMDVSNFDQDCIEKETKAKKCSWSPEGF